MGVEAWLGRGAIQTLGVAGAEVTAGEVVSRAIATVGSRSIRVASRQVAEEAAEKFLGQGSQPIRALRGAGEIIGKISADGQRVVRYTSAEKAVPYINLENKVTGGNLHVHF
jgi:hypothetical protein